MWQHGSKAHVCVAWSLAGSAKQASELDEKLLNHEDRAGLALSYSELCVGLPAGLRRLPVSSKTCTGVMFGASRAFALRKTCTGVVLGASRALKHAQM